MNKTSTLPTISIGIPTYNGANRIEQAIKSVQAQSYDQLEIVISDNASTDDTEAVCRKMAAEDPRIKYYRQQENIGQNPNFAYVLQVATGDYFMWIADDDELVPGILENYLNFLKNNPDHALVCGQITYHRDGVIRRTEKGLSFTQDNPIERVAAYYARVVDGGMWYGLLHREKAAKIPIRPTIGCDWHFVAAMAFQGKVRQLDFVGYSKSMDGTSRDFKNYARVFGEHPFWAHAPYLKIARDTFLEVGFRYELYKSIGRWKRLKLAFRSTCGVLYRFYGIRFPKIMGGHIKRSIGLKTQHK
ncbi:MAG: glycosyltransferase family 2 protein [Bacteroidota bacterium]